MNAEDVKVLEKIKKLLALATSPEEHEASAAAERAHRLLLKHNLTMGQVQDRMLSEYDQRVVETRTFQRTEEKFVAWILEAHFFVRWMQRRRKGPNWGQNGSISTWYERDVYLIGTKPNVEVAYFVRAFLIDKFYKLWLEYRRRTRCEAREQQSYYLGLHAGLDKKLMEQRFKVEQEMGLVLVADPNLQELMKDAKNSGSYNRNFGHDAKFDGVEDGYQIEIQRALKEESKSRSGAALALEDKTKGKKK